MGGDTLTYVRLPAILLLFILANSAGVSVSSELPALSVAKFASLQLSPSLVVENSPGSRPGSHVVCERVEIIGLPRLTNLTSFFSSVKVRLTNVNSTGRPPSITVCFHRNASLGVGMCPDGLWEKLTNGSWVRSMSPFDHKLLDIRSVDPSVGTVEVVLNEEFYLYRVVFFILGITMMTFASSLSNSLATYYGGAMTLGVLLVVLVILFQGMRILPSGRKSSLALVLYGSIVGVGSFLFSYVPTLLRSLLVEMGISEDLYSPVAAFLLAFVVLCGAWLGFWAVRKLVLTEDGSIDTGVAQFVAWSIRVVASSMILQCSVDPLLAVAALVCGILVPSCAKGLLRYYAPKTLRVKHIRSHKPVEDASSYENKHELKLSDSDTFYSTFHKTPVRKQYSKDEWDKFTQDSTKKALESLVWSPDFNRWAVANAERLALLPKKDTNPRPKSWFSWS
ncbi:putative NEMP family protein [Helianthus annuus]|nr:putative NEMP family protein [Helianthus annuus]KAJ0879800.1 putative NEMP family protein [Helianthus annuus]